jgi:hypothetical protein
VPLSSGDDPALTACHYVTLYWFTAPVQQSVTDFIELGARTYLSGRRPELPYVKRPFGKPFLPVEGYVNPRIFVSAEVLPIRPNRGVYISVSDLSGEEVAVHGALQWYNEVRIPDLLECHGVAGAWVLASEDGFARQQPGMHSSMRATILYLDEDPVDVMSDIDSRRPKWKRKGRYRDTSEVETVHFASPLRSIVPWQWDWFD